MMNEKKNNFAIDFSLFPDILIFIQRFVDLLIHSLIDDNRLTTCI
jgi:hemerythrin-like domain-containing protein